MKKLFHAINIAHSGKDHPVDVKNYGYFVVWNSQEDMGWKNYCNARSLISEYKTIEKLLKLLHYI